ncbi:adenosylcobalamin-dependent ribonucleoside-diphosphate reductase [Fodinicurvata fenggangensis]|uniref:adenosylcobalamin-dependent ribonucleoside-diphosphate reductase n=1 Tax=Fodinicurvata fenggangensis TaxID=1121830 RepID=UPI0009DE92B3
MTDLSQSRTAKSALSPFSQRIWEMKYRLTSVDGSVKEETVADSWARVARALAAQEDEPSLWEERFQAILEDFRFLPGGRILAGSGSERDVTLFNCFVMGTIPDDLGGIFEHLREAALTLQQGGGIGYDFSTLRPTGAHIRSIDAEASGPVSFMEVWDRMCATIMSAGARRGAMMGTLRCDHPDIERFIAAKQQKGRLTNFNLSVLVTDAFMEAVRQDRDWPLRFEGRTWRSLPARTLWNRILESTYAYSEPGVIFIDRINRLNNLAYCEQISATNPCGEQPLPPYGACLLGSVNLMALVRHPFTEQADLDLDALEQVTRTAVRLLDNAIDSSRFPLVQQEREAHTKRRIGLGVTGLADALICCNLRYGSPEALAAIRRWMTVLRRAAYEASCDLAVEKGPFPLFDAKHFLAGEGLAWLDDDLRGRIAEHGLRNALLTSIAPTGTISLLADNVSSGIEPVFAYGYTRNLLTRSGERQQEEVTDPAYKLYRQDFETDPPDDIFVDARSLSPRAHLETQAVVQDYIDAAVSKTVNVPEDMAFEDFKGLYDLAWDLGCKGCTTYRPSKVRGAVLEVT